MNRFENKVILVTGAGSGIGQETAARFAREGAKVMIVGRTAKTLEETAALHANISYTVADISTQQGLDDVYEAIQTEYGKLDVLVNNAGVAPVAPLKEVSRKEVQTTLATNVEAVNMLTQKLLPFILKSKGNIINIGSANGVRPMPNMAIYSASKAAVLALTRAWAKELAADGIRVNNVSVGPIETPIYGKTELSVEEAAAHKARVEKIVPLGRFGTVQECAAVIAFLASDEASYVTGADFAVDGGVGA